MRESQSQGCLVAPITLSPVVVRPWDAARDLDWAYRVWTSSLSEKWSLQRAQLKSRLAAATEVYVAEDRGVPIALCAVGYQGVEAAGLLLIMVDPFSVGQGVGKKLLTHLEDALAATGIEQLTRSRRHSFHHRFTGATARPSLRKSMSSTPPRSQPRTLDSSISYPKSMPCQTQSRRR